MESLTAKKQLLLECAEAFEENCEHEGKLASFVALAQRCRAAACAESDLLSAVQLLIEAPKCSCPDTIPVDCACLCHKPDFLNAEFALDVLREMDHARIFIRTREKMHPDGIAQFDAVWARLRRMLEQRR